MEYKEALEVLKTNSRFEKNVHGQEIRIKDIPEGLGWEGKMDPRVAAHNRKAAENAPDHELTLEEIREGMNWETIDVTGSRIPQYDTRVQTERDSVSVRVYGKEEGKEKPCILYYHGGGFIAGTIKSFENPCRALSMYGEAVVISTDYALAPEHPFPQGFHDCWSVLSYVYSHSREFGIDRERIVLCGDSAGANMSAACAIRDKEEKLGAVKGQILIYPTVNPANLPNSVYTWDRNEYDIQGDETLASAGIGQFANVSEFLIPLYLSGDLNLAKNPYAAPVFADVHGVAPALIINAEYDFLRLEGEAYGRYLTAAGVSAANLRYRGVDHGFIEKMGEYPQAEDCMREAALWFRSVVK